ncbi:MAG: hypothetical protein HYY24_14385 [Verrucomicrobia bacterium]|nr:hypothetical protein [Verrucomicrobiota bacterium]
MNSRGELKHFVYAALMALGLYVGFFYGCEYRRNFRGPWQVTFTADTNSQPAIIINQPKLQITNVQLVFAGEPRPPVPTPETVSFASPTNEAAFGKVIFRDTTFLPGTLTLDLFGHEIELLPRVLGIDRREHAWQSETTILLPPKK